VNGFWSAIFGSLIISIFNWIVSSVINEQGRVQYIDLRKKGDGTWE
jgi:putative membrane protein